MRNPFIALLLILLTGTASSQSITLADSITFKRIIAGFIARDAANMTTIFNAGTGGVTYQPKYIQTFDSLFKPILGKVMLGDQDLINQGSAYALAVDQIKSTLSINYSWTRSNKFFYNTGFAATSSSKVFPVFSKGQWQQGITLTGGITRPFNKILFFTPGDDFDTIKHRYKANFLQETYALLRKDSTTRFRLKYIDSILNPRSSDELETYCDISGLEGMSLGDLTKLDEQVKKAQMVRDITNDPSKLSKFIDSAYAGFETKYFKDINYSFWWFNLLLRPEYKGLSIYDTAVSKVGSIKRNNTFRIGIEGYLNYARNMTKYLLLSQGGVGIKNTNYLEGKKASDLTFLQNLNGDSVKFDGINQAVVVDSFNLYKKHFVLITPVIGANIFFGKKRIFGWEAFYSTKIGLNSKRIPFKDLLTIRTGPLFSFKGKDALAKSTFGLLVQWEDVPYKGAKFNDYFTFNVRIGIPFNF